jgi:hypothetical protein
MMLQNERASPIKGKGVDHGLSDKAPVNVKISSREVIGGASTFGLILSGRHAIDVLVGPIQNCATLSCAISHVWALTDLEFAGFLLFSSGLLGAVLGLGWSLWPTTKALIDRGLDKWHKRINRPRAPRLVQDRLLKDVFSSKNWTSFRRASSIDENGKLPPMRRR